MIRDVEFKIGQKIWFAREKRPYKVRACDGRYAICTKPHNPKRTVLYTIIDKELEIRGIREMRDKLCPVCFYLPLGLLVVMPRANVLEYGAVDVGVLDAFCNGGTYKIPAELKYDSFGYLNGRLVAVDYGS